MVEDDVWELVQVDHTLGAGGLDPVQAPEHGQPGRHLQERLGGSPRYLSPCGDERDDIRRLKSRPVGEAVDVRRGSFDEELLHVKRYREVQVP